MRRVLRLGGLSQVLVSETSLSWVPRIQHCLTGQWAFLPVSRDNEGIREYPERVSKPDLQDKVMLASLIIKHMKMLILSVLVIWVIYNWYLYCNTINKNISVQFSRLVVSDSLRPHESQHTRPPCPSPTPRVHSNSCPSSWWCHPAISSSVVPFSSCP